MMSQIKSKVIMLSDLYAGLLWSANRKKRPPKSGPREGGTLLLYNKHTVNTLSHHVQCYMEAPEQRNKKLYRYWKN